VVSSAHKSSNHKNEDITVMIDNTNVNDNGGNKYQRLDNINDLLVNISYNEISKVRDSTQHEGKQQW